MEGRESLAQRLTVISSAGTMVLSLTPGPWLSEAAAADADFERRWHSEHEILLTKPQFSLTLDTLISALILLSI